METTTDSKTGLPVNPDGTSAVGQGWSHSVSVGTIKPQGTLYSPGKEVTEMWFCLGVALLGVVLLVVGALTDNERLVESGIELVGFIGIAFTASRTVTKFSQAIAERKQ